MPKVNGEIRFHNDQFLIGDVGNIDELKGIVRGVSLIQKGMAEGHDLVVDDILLHQLRACGKERGKVPVNLDHGSGITSTCGYVTSFRVDQDKLRGDLYLLKSHPETPVLLERAAKMPECFGLSVAFKPPEGLGKKGERLTDGRFAARCDKLMSVDLVTRPAANAGLFSVPPSVDNSKLGMAKEKKETQLAEGEAEPTLQDVLAAVNDLKGRLDQQDQFNQQVIDHLNAGNEPSLQDLVDASDEELAELGLTRAEVDAAVQEVLAGMEGEPGIADDHTAGEGNPAGVEAAPAAAPAMAGVDGSPAGASALKALQKDVIRLENKLKIKELNEKKQAEEVQLAEIEQKVLILADQRDKAIALAEKLESENEALRMAVRTGTRPVKAGVDNGMRMFGANDNGELHEFQLRVKQLKESGKSEAEAIQLAVKENPASHADWLNSQRRKPATAA